MRKENVDVLQEIMVSVLELQGDIKFSKLKKELSDALIATICPIGKKIRELKKDEKYLIEILKNGSNRAKEIAKTNINKVKDIVGFI